MLQTLQFLTIATDDYVQDAGVAISSETHAGEDTQIYARGPMSFLFQVCISYDNGKFSIVYIYLIISIYMNDIKVIKCNLIFFRVSINSTT